MTPAEINIAMAEMMGDEINQHTVGLLPTCDNKPYRWNPCENIEQAMMCEAKIVADIPCSDGNRYFFDMRHVVGAYIARLQHPMACYVDDGRCAAEGFEDFSAEHASPAMAICLACLAVVEKKQ